MIPAVLQAPTLGTEWLELLEVARGLLNVADKSIVLRQRQLNTRLERLFAHSAPCMGSNQWPDGSGGGGPASSTGKVTADAAAGAANWIFFAVTYNSHHFRIHGGK